MSNLQPLGGVNHQIITTPFGSQWAVRPENVDGGAQEPGEGRVAHFRSDRNSPWQPAPADAVNARLNGEYGVRYDDIFYSVSGGMIGLDPEPFSLPPERRVIENDPSESPSIPSSPERRVIENDPSGSPSIPSSPERRVTISY